MRLIRSFLMLSAIVLTIQAQAEAVLVQPGPSTDPWIGFMNVSELPSNGGAFVFGSGWGVSDLTATFDDPNGKISLTPNTIGDPDPFWYIGGGAPGNPGNKIMEANLFIQETGTFAGETVNFRYRVMSDTTTAAHDGFAFIRDFAPDFSSFNETKVPLVAGATNTISLATINDPNRHVQYGFQMIGENVWITDTAPFGAFVIGVPEPGTIALAGLGLIGVLGTRRRK